MHLLVQVTAKSIPNLKGISDCGLRNCEPAQRVGVRRTIAYLIFLIEIICFLNMHSVITHLQLLLLHLPAKTS
jgi:hypothetical protein